MRRAPLHHSEAANMRNFRCLLRAEKLLRSPESRSFVEFASARPASSRLHGSFEERMPFQLEGRRLYVVESRQTTENPSSLIHYDTIVKEQKTKKKAGKPKIKEEKEGSKEKEEQASVSSGSSYYGFSAFGARKNGRKVTWVCSVCEFKSGQWWGNCPHCHGPELKEFVELDGGNRARGFDVSDAVVKSWLHQRPGELAPIKLSELMTGRDDSAWRIPLSGCFGMEFARVVGGGIVPGSLNLIGGDPGVGKSTLLLQLAAVIAEGSDGKTKAPVVYVSGEESMEQIGSRANRMRITTSELYLYSDTDIEEILDKVQGLSPRAVIVDSIQTVYLRGVTGSAGNTSQLRECTAALLRFAKRTNIPIFLIGHVTKAGDIAGPRLLEHIVDVVLYMEGERHSNYRLLRSVKNRFGSTDELGVFEMSNIGLQAVMNPSQIFMSEQIPDSEVLAGHAVSVIVDGSRAFVLDIQALCVSDFPSGHPNGISRSRAQMIIAVLMKQAGLQLKGHGIFLNVVSGLKLKETAGDLAVAAAICSSFLEFPIPNDIAFIGEIGLSGELRAAPQMNKRVIALVKLGYKKCVIPKSAIKQLAMHDLEIEILGCSTVKEMINAVFQSEGTYTSSLIRGSFFR